MRYASFLLVPFLGFNLVATAYPWMQDPGYEPPSKQKKALLGGLGENLGGLLNGLAGPGGLLEGLVGSVASAVDPSNKRPDAAHPFQAPGPNDQRGPCPGLNTLANHGYLPRNGIVTAGQVVSAVSEGFNMGADLSSLLVFVAVAFGGNLATETFSLGGEDDRTYSSSGIGSKALGRQYGLDGHSRCEGDISATRRDYFTNNGDNHNAYPDRFKRLMEIAKRHGGQFNVDALNEFYGQNAQESINNNPQLYFEAYTIIVILGEYPFIPNFFSNGTYGAGGDSNFESIASFLGMSVDSSGTICYVPERFPENWYRRSYPYGVAQLVEGLVPTYLTGPELTLPNPLGILQNGAQTAEIGCAIYQGITSGIPASLLGETNDFISNAVTFLQNKLLPTIPSIYGCSPNQPSLQEDSNGGGQYSTPNGGVQQSYNICA